MIFNEELTLLKEKIANAEDVDELNYIRTTNQKKNTGGPAYLLQVYFMVWTEKWEKWL